MILNVLLFSLFIPTIRADAPSYVPEQCDGFIQLQYDILNFDRYDEYYNEQTTLTLAQTGTYQGPDKIEEYVRFATISSPYVAEKYNYNMTNTMSGFDSIDGVCTFLIYSTQGTRFDDNLTKGGLISYGAIQKIYYSIPQNKVTIIHGYYSEAYISAYFGSLDTDENLEYICDVLTGPSCVDELNGNLSANECKKEIYKLPMLDDGGYTDTNNRGCRALHAVFAEDNPSHCAHISLVPVEDVDGKIKCQESEGIMPLDMFSEDEILALEQMCLSDKQIGSASCVNVSDQVVETPPPTASPSKVKNPKPKKKKKGKKKPKKSKKKKNKKKKKKSV